MNKIIDLNDYRTNSDKIQIMSTNHIKDTTIRKNKFYILIGAPASGKTTYAEKHLKNINTVIVSTDDIRTDMFKSYQFSYETNDLVFDMAQNQIESALNQGLDIVFDATNTYKKHRKDILKIAKAYNCYTYAIVLKTPLGVCLERNSKREMNRRVPVASIIRMSKSAFNISKSEGFDEINYIILENNS